MINGDSCILDHAPLNFKTGRLAVGQISRCGSVSDKVSRTDIHAFLYEKEFLKQELAGLLFVGV